MCRRSLPPPLSLPSAKLMIMALEEYGYQSGRGIRVPKKWMSSYFDDVIFLKGDEGPLRGGFCLVCNSKAENSLTYDSDCFNEKEEPPQNSDIRHLIKEHYGIKVCEKQKQNMKDTMLELLEGCRQQEFDCMHNDVDDLIESALNSKLLSINLRSQRLNKKKQEVNNIVEQLTKRGNRIAESLQNFRVKKSSTSLNNTYQISPVNEIALVLPTEEPKYSLSMGYENLSTTSEMESDEIIKSSVEKLVPIQSDDDDDFEDIKYVEASHLDSELVSLEEENDGYQEEKEFDLENILQIQYVILREKLLSINRLIADIEFLNDNSTLDRVLKSSFSFPIFEKGQLFLALDNLIPPGIGNIDYDPEGDIHFLEELLSNDSIPLPKNKSSNFDHHDDPSFPCPPLEPPDVEFFFDFEPNSEELIAAVINNIYELIEDECFNPGGGKIDVFTNIKDDDYFSFIFAILIFLLYLIYLEVSPLLLSTGCEDTIFDPGIST
nr:hypothetical protein [Tanacetum cinerariifolium]